MITNESRRWYTMPDMIVALSAVLISLCTFAVSGYEAWLQRHHDRAEVWPHVELSLVNTPDQSTLSIDNTGIGPAIIKSMKVTSRSPDGSMAKFARVAIEICYSSVFDDSWRLTDAHLGGESQWKETGKCSVVAGSEF